VPNPDRSLLTPINSYEVPENPTGLDDSLANSESRTILFNLNLIGAKTYYIMCR